MKINVIFPIIPTTLLHLIVIERIGCGLVDNLRKHKIWAESRTDYNLVRTFQKVVRSEIKRIDELPPGDIEKIAKTDDYSRMPYPIRGEYRGADYNDLREQHRLQLTQVCLHLNLRLGAIADGYWENMNSFEGHFCRLIYPIANASILFYIQALSIPHSETGYRYRVVANTLLAHTRWNGEPCSENSLEYANLVLIRFKEKTCVEIAKYQPGKNAEFYCRSLATKFIDLIRKFERNV